MSGYVYVARNDAFWGLVKVGYTTRNVQVRMAELNGTGVPGQTVAVYWAATDKPHRLEQLVHLKLHSARESKNREFFAVSAADARRAIRQAAAFDGILILREWSDEAVDLEDKWVRLEKAKSNLKKYHALYDECMGSAYTSNPFKRGAQIDAKAKMHDLAGKILACEQEIDYLESL
jgi:hypothetical protein